MDFDWKSIVRTVAPFIGGSLGGPVGAAAASAISKALLGKDSATDNELEEAIRNATPEQLAELKKIDNDFKVKMAELGFSEKELHYKDRQGARKLFEVNIYPQIVLSAVFITGYFIILYFVMGGLMSSDMAIEVKMMVATLIGVLTGEVPRIMSFWFGSSTGSKEKTAKLEAR